jgi:formylglycine-generating enzyme required for sulfatase activity
MVAWAEASRVDRKRAYTAFLAAWPSGRYASAATQRLRQIRRGEKRLWLALALSAPGLIIGALALFNAAPGWVARAIEWYSRPSFHPPQMVTIPAGRFWRGSPPEEDGRGPDEGPLKVVTIAKPFQIGKFEVTFDEWDVCVADGGCAYSPSANGWGRGRRPVIFISWDDAQGYLAWLSRKTGRAYRLPSEAEWEYAARAGTGTAYAFGADIAPSQAAFSTDRTAPVGSFAANAFGVHDMHGNVWEWVQDCYRESYDEAPTDGSPYTGTCAKRERVVRGGAWFNTKKYLRSAARDSDEAHMRYDILGFRVARSID